MSGRDDRAADMLADSEPMECRECCGTGLVLRGFSDTPCLYCEGTGYWLGQA